MRQEKIDNRTILSYGILSLPIGVLGIPMGIYLAPFYAGELGLPLAVIELKSPSDDMGAVDEHRIVEFAPDQLVEPFRNSGPCARIRLDLS